MNATNATPQDLTDFVFRSHNAALQLAHIPALKKNQVLLEIAEALKQQRDRILEANTLDLEASREMSVPDVVLEWLKLTPERLQNAIDCLKQLVTLPDPLSDRFDHNHQRRVPLGAVAFVYEAFPQLSIIAAGMCLKAGNSSILKGGSEGSNSNAAIATIIKEVVSHSLPEASVMAVPQGSTMKDLLTQEKYLRLVIPYGRPSFVQQVSKQGTVSVLPTAMGNCYLYLSPSASLEEASKMIKSSRSGDPDPVNAIEKVVVHHSWLERGLVDWIGSLQQQGLNVRGCDGTVAYCRDRTESLTKEVSAETVWGQAYLDHTIALKLIHSVDDAIAWINQYSSGHADVILTDSLAESQHFATQVNSSIVFINASSRFTHGGVNGEKIGTARVALGMSSIKTRGASRHTGAIDLSALTATKQIIVQ
jgi:glutamate-5-semialdehyde dehydrogenase